MNKPTAYILGLLMSLVLSLGANDVFAARMGGGKSFGSRPSYSMPYQRPTPGSPGLNRPATPAQQPAWSAAQQRNQAARDALSQRGGFARFLGGMALGGLLGAMFFGGGFEGINFLDLLMFAGIAFLLFRFLAARRAGSERVASPGGHYDVPREAETVLQRRADHGASGAGFDTDILSRKAGGAPLESSAPAAPVLPADFDTASFLGGARSAYQMMQKAWDEADLATLRGLTTDKVFGELQDQIRARGDRSNQTDLLKVEAELLEVRDVGADREVSVLFDVLMRESAEAQPAQVREVWHFTRARNSRQPTWFLDGIQQLDDQGAGHRHVA